MFKRPFTPFLLLFAVGCTTLSPTDYRPRVSETIRQELRQEDIEIEIEFGRDIAARILQQQDGLDSRSQQMYINLVGQTLVGYSSRSELDFYFYVLDSDQINAYATPGGYVFITTAALGLMENEAELAGVLAHEIAHVDERHIVNALNIRATGQDAAFSQIVGGSSGETLRVAFDQAIDGAIGILFETGLQRDDEFEADQKALYIATSSGYDPNSFYQYLNRVSQYQGDALKEVNSTHPPFSERADRIQQTLQDEGMDQLQLAKMADRFDQEIAR